MDRLDLIEEYQNNNVKQRCTSCGELFDPEDMFATDDGQFCYECDEAMEHEV